MSETFWNHLLFRLYSIQVKCPISHTWQESSTSVSSATASGLAGSSFSFSMGLNSTFFISLSRMSGLAALISIFRLAVGVQGSTRVDCLMGVMWARSGVAPSLPMSKTGTGSVDFSGVDLLHSVQMFSCDDDKWFVVTQLLRFQTFGKTGGISRTQKWKWWSKRRHYETLYNL